MSVLFSDFPATHCHHRPAADESKGALSFLWELCLWFIQGGIWDLSSGLFCMCTVKTFAVLLWISSTHAQLMHEPKTSGIDLGSPLLFCSFFSVIPPTFSGTKRLPFLDSWTQSWDFIFPALSHTSLYQVVLRGEIAREKRKKNNGNFSLNCSEYISFIS